MRALQNFWAAADAMTFPLALKWRAATIGRLKRLSTTCWAACAGRCGTITRGLRGSPATVRLLPNAKPTQGPALIGAARSPPLAATAQCLGARFADAQQGFYFWGLRLLTFELAHLTGPSADFDSETRVNSAKNF